MSNATAELTNPVLSTVPKVGALDRNTVIGACTPSITVYNDAPTLPLLIRIKSITTDVNLTKRLSMLHRLLSEDGIANASWKYNMVLRHIKQAEYMEHARKEPNL